MKFLSFLLLLASSFTHSAQLPNPLTLGDTLKLANEHNYAEKQQLLNIDAEQHRLIDWKNQYGITTSIDLQLAQRSDYGSAVDNSHAFVHLKKTLYNQAIEIGKDTQQNTLNNATLSFQQLQQDKTIEVMRSFFDIILADMSYETIMENLSILAVREGRIKDDYDIQHASELELLEKKTSTQASQIQRIKVESEQIKTRAKLAQLLNVNYENRPDEVIKPDYKSLFKKDLADFSDYQKKLTNNLKLKQLKQYLLSIGRQISQQKDNLGIVINSSVRLGEQGYQREKNGQWRAGLQLSVPFGANTKQDSKISQLIIQSKKKQLEIEKVQQDLLREALDYHFNLSALRQTHKALIVELDYRDLYLEKARADYELEIKSDIGTAMVNYTDTEKKLAENEFNYIITLKKLHHLIGEEYEI